MKQRKNIGSSLRQRLLNFSKHENRPYNEVLQYYAMDRFLHRLAHSIHANRYILKGALMLRVWRFPESRPTMDIDMLGVTANSVDEITDHMKEIMVVEVDPDGLTFDPTSIRTEHITQEAAYEGIRIRFCCFLDTAKIYIQIDLGFGDVVYPEVERLELPSILNFPTTCLLCYSRESSIAEKFEAMIKLSFLNSRMKDFYDVWLLSRLFNFEGSVLAKAIQLTFEQRETELPLEVEFASQRFIKEKQEQWTAFRRRIDDENIPDSFQEVVDQLERFLLPIIHGFFCDQSPPEKWIAPGPWA